MPNSFVSRCFNLLPGLFLFAATLSGNGADAPSNLGGGLRQLAEAQSAAPALPGRQAVKEPVDSLTSNPRLQRDASGRVVADVYLLPTAQPQVVQAGLVSLGAAIIGSEPPGRSSAARDGVISVRIPVAAAAAAAKLPGVRSISLAHRPWRHVGSVTSQGVVAMKANLAIRRHVTGAGITVGVISDSFDLVAPHAAADVRRGDLPGPLNPAHRTTPVVVLQEGDPSDDSNIDEGRAMLQIVHDVAPDAKLAFASVGSTQATFAAAIRRLRTDAAAHCDVLVDDIVFPEEPFFSDGMVAQAVEDVVNSTTLDGKKAIYYSAAGNEGDLGYEADFSMVDNSTARAGNAGVNNLKLFQVPDALTAGGFHNFGAGATVQIVQQLKIEGDFAELAFQWNDLFDPASMTSDYNLLVFDEIGNYLPDFSGTDDNFAVGTASEIVDLFPHRDGTAKTYQIAITKTAAGTGTARHFRYIVETDASVDGDFLQQKVPTIFGHSGARSADAVGAYKFNRMAEPESFSSFGPVTIYFDDAGNRLVTPEVRAQPTLSAPDGVVTTVIRPFFGTSAAAPHAAGVAALLLQAQGGPGSLDSAGMRQALQSTTRSHDLNPFTASAQLQSAAGQVTVSGSGDTNNISSNDPAFFTIHFDGSQASRLLSVAIDLSTAGLKFDQSTALGFPFTIDSSSGGLLGTVKPVLGVGLRGTANSLLTLRFSDFTGGGTIKFGIDRDVASTHGGGNSADALAHGIVTARVFAAGASAPTVLRAFFLNQTGAGYTPADGFGFLNADAALRALGH